MPKDLYQLQVPPGSPDELLRSHITVPFTPDGIKMAAWWHEAPLEARREVMRAGDDTGDFVQAWRKVADDLANVIDDDKKEQDLKSIIQRAEKQNDDLGPVSDMEDPPMTNP